MLNTQLKMATGHLHKYGFHLPINPFLTSIINPSVIIIVKHSVKTHISLAAVLRFTYVPQPTNGGGAETKVMVV